MEHDYPPLRDYGSIGNDDRCALVSRYGSIDWCCFPHLESPSVFARLLDATDGGHFTVSPTADDFESSHQYADRTNVLQTTFETESGQVTLTDFMPIQNGDAAEQQSRNQDSDDQHRDQHQHPHQHPHQHQHQHPHPQHAIYRQLECDRGSMECQVVFEPRLEYARVTPALETSDGGVTAVRGGGRSEPGNDDDDDDDGVDGHVDDNADWLEQRHQPLHYVGDVDLEINEAAAKATGTVTLEAGDTCWLGVQYGGEEPQGSPSYQEWLDETKHYWREWVGDREGVAESVSERWHEMVIRSELVLKLLIHHETGAIPAAATTSVPEEIGSERTWDYRYNWIRDAKFTVQALHDTGHRQEARDYFDWFVGIATDHPTEIRPLYGLHGEYDDDLEERTLDHLSGYRDTGPVRIGNGAASQLQLDVYGTFVQAIYETIQFDEEAELSEDSWDAVIESINHVCRNWDQPDAGIWEFRDEHRHFLHSKLLCWVALDRGIALAEANDFDAPLEHWRDTRDEVRGAIETRGYSEEAGSFVQYFDSDEAIDATALLIPIYEFLPPEDERVQSTIDTVLEKLTTDDGLVVRFVDTDVREDEEEGFLLCSFWLIDALVLSNRLELATEYFESLLEYTSPLGLYSEKVDPDSGRLLGNFPQAFSHLGLINSVSYLARAIDAEGDVSPEDFHPENVETLFRRGDEDVVTE
ncbi:glycoside hydrolase family protein (homolog to trehalase) [Natrialba magadii ATCC 43099]|uniref:Glycoside hydrolase 15-like protein n=1 Tax=Natrialba magadii (strain ATCC 43099 / DSM 3394 / CCM 3739 / CIP 104546 / IAM 13178 / JCM 8861 / NBRC 102185 / NCIMB 2190 / MS3) TaxID=547559 RepID=D3SRM3_NATMM|nr:glycoside hydrolase family 15 protein [Natrialba magadii]ADD04728.1 glycoside hydrolase family protein (homolog to trehalase) [Natrialba magadii ATCC 43099]ELY24895.1 glycoside hydrolase 15-like protein [Natrialba magadii ATCC 43099]